MLTLFRFSFGSVDHPMSPACVCGESVENDPKCASSQYAGRYPNCSLFRAANGLPIPCDGLMEGHSCDFTGTHANSTPPTPASWHLHVFFPSVGCTNCSAEFTVERQNFTFAGQPHPAQPHPSQPHPAQPHPPQHHSAPTGAMQLRALIAAGLTLVVSNSTWWKREFVTLTSAPTASRLLV